MDRQLYRKNMQDILFNYPNLSVRAASVYDLVLDQHSPSTSFAPLKVGGVKLGNRNI